VGPTLRSYHTHEQHFACSPRVSRLITFPPTSWLLLPWQASPPGKVRSDEAHPLISTPHRLRTSEIPMPKSVSSAVTHRCHHQPALPFRDWHPFTKQVLILVEEISSTFVPRCYAVFSPSLILVLKPQSLLYRVNSLPGNNKKYLAILKK